MPDETTILRFRHLLEKQQLAPQVLATINAGLAMRRQIGDLSNRLMTDA